MTVWFAGQSTLAESMVVILIGLFIIDFVIPSLVFGPWYYGSTPSYFSA